MVVVNTCGFIDSAVAESLDAIGEAMAENGKVIVTGCLGASRTSSARRIPACCRSPARRHYDSVMAAVHEAAPPSHDPFIDLVPPQGVKLTPQHYAYLKISEGCNHRCSFCIIPSLRGDLVSRPVGDVLREAEKLVKAGVKELLVISPGHQRLRRRHRYAAEPLARARRSRRRFLDLCERLGELGIWMRLHYVYPYPHVDDVIPLMAEGKILPYLDIPFQHATPARAETDEPPGAR